MAEEYYQGSQGAGSFVEKLRREAQIILALLITLVKIEVEWKSVAKEEVISIFFRKEIRRHRQDE